MKRSFVERIANERGYHVSEDGNTVASPHRPEPRRLYCDDRGYLQFCISIEQRRTRHCTVHRLQAYQKFGEEIYTEGIEVRHLDGNKTNNSAQNLALGTPKENASDKSPTARLWTALNASKHAQRHDHAEILRRHNLGESYRTIMAALGITSKGTISFVVNKSFLART